MKRPFLKWLILLILLGALSFFPHCGKNVKESGLAPEFSLKTLEGQEMTLASLKGKVVLIDFWATWCGPCRESIPHLVTLYKNYREKGFEVIGVSVDKEKRKWFAVSANPWIFLILFLSLLRRSREVML